jgi:hypothetical protein
MRLRKAIVITSIPLAMAGVGTVTAAAASASTPPAIVMAQYAQHVSLSGKYAMTIPYAGQNWGYTLHVREARNGDLTGSLTDTAANVVLPLRGQLNGNVLTFDVSYPAGSVQGSRAFVAVLAPHAHTIAGVWVQTGSQSPDNGTFTMQHTR